MAWKPSPLNPRPLVCALLLGWVGLSSTGCALLQKKSHDSEGYSASDEEHTDWFDYLNPAHNYKRFKKSIGQGPNEKVARKAFDEGMTEFRTKSYTKAAQQFTVAYDRWPDSPLEEDAMFYAGESYFFDDRYSSADDEYGVLLKKYPSTQYLDRVVNRRFAIATYWQSLPDHWPVTPNFTDKTCPYFDTKGYAMKIYERIRLDDPTGPLADDAVMRTATAHFEHRRYEDADYYFTLLRNEYPKSEHLYEAHILGLQAKLLKYQGPDYDGKPLKEAETLAAQTLKAFPRETGKDRDWLSKVQAELKVQFALRDLTRGDFYEKTSHYASAKRSYDKVVKNYPETQLAAKAQEHISANADKQQVPTPPLEWLAKIVPEAHREGVIKLDPKTEAPAEPVIQASTDKDKSLR
jgi:outer membrane protein assembly factor BamD (BamD/ComL family)